MKAAALLLVLLTGCAVQRPPAGDACKRGPVVVVVCAFAKCDVRLVPDEVDAPASSKSGACQTSEGLQR